MPSFHMLPTSGELSATRATTACAGQVLLKNSQLFMGVKYEFKELNKYNIDNERSRERIMSVSEAQYSEGKAIYF